MKAFDEILEEHVVTVHYFGIDPDKTQLKKYVSYFPVFL